jgi:hypothetical protein
MDFEVAGKHIELHLLGEGQKVGDDESEQHGKDVCEKNSPREVKVEAK